MKQKLFSAILSIALAAVLNTASASQIAVEYDPHTGVYIPCIYTIIGPLAAQLNADLSVDYVRGAPSCTLYNAYYVWDEKALILFDVKGYGSRMINIE